MSSSVSASTMSSTCYISSMPPYFTPQTHPHIYYHSHKYLYLCCHFTHSSLSADLLLPSSNSAKSPNQSLKIPLTCSKLYNYFSALFTYQGFGHRMVFLSVFIVFHPVEGDLFINSMSLNSDKFEISFDLK